MIITLLIATFVVAFVVATIVVLLFGRSMETILRRIVSDDIAQAWARYLKFAIYVIGIGGGVRVWSFEKYLVAQQPYNEVVQLTPERWALEVYDTIISTLQSSATVLLVFFVFALIAVVIVRFVEARAAKT
jgi:hypothetical protein